MTHPMTLDLSAIEAIARAATPGEWKWTCSSFGEADEPGSLSAGDEPILYAFAGDGPTGYTRCEPADARHIASASPSVVLALVERVRELEQHVEIMKGNPRNPHGVELHVYKRSQEASVALGAANIGELPVKASEAAARIREIEAALVEACEIAQYLSNNLEGDSTYHDARIAALRALLKP